MLPRERLIKYGPKSLEVEELFAIILGTGTKDEDVFTLSKRIFDENNLHALLDLTYQELIKIKGIKNAKATKIIASIELAKRIFSYVPSDLRYDNPMTIFNQLKSYYLGKKNEELVCLYLDKRFHLIKMQSLSSGDDNRVLVDQNKLFRFALKYDSKYLMLVHNHPSGILEPSTNDLLVTKAILEQAEKLEIILLDHIIISNQGFYSFLEHKMLK